MSETVSAFFLRRLHERGVRRIYGYLIEVITDPEVPPLPPHIRFEQAKGFAASLASGGSDRGAMVRQAIKGKVEEFVRR